MDMDDAPTSALGYINRGIAHHAAGSLDDARAQFVQAILKEPDNEYAWLWLAEVSNDPGEQRYCFDRAIEINPDSAARVRRTALASADAKVPPELADVDKPAIPPSLKTEGHVRLAKLPLPPRPRITFTPVREDMRRLGWRRLTAILAGVVLLAVASWLVVVQPWKDEPAYLVAVVGPMSGPDRLNGEDMLRGARLAIDSLDANNRQPSTRLVVFDSQDDPAEAEAIANRIVADDRIAGVIDFSSSDVSVVTAPIYNRANIAVVASRASPDALAQYPSYFGLTVNNSTEGAMLAQYMRFGFEFDRASMIVGPGTHEQEGSEAFSRQFAADGEMVATWQLAGTDRDAAIAAIVEGIRATPEPGIVLLALTETDARDVLLAIRRAGLDPPMVGFKTQGGSEFESLFVDEPEERDAPGFFTDGLYASIPIMYESIGSDALAVARRYNAKHGVEIGWRGIKGYEAVLTLDYAIHARPIGDVDAPDRDQVVASLRALNDPSVALPGLVGPIFFNESGFVPQGLALGQYDGGRFVSAPFQYRLVTNPDRFDIEADLAGERAFQLDDRIYRAFRVVYVGVEMIDLRNLQVAEETYTASFFLYFRYLGDDAPLDVVFVNAIADVPLGESLNTSVDDEGMTYQLYRVEGTFSESMNFVDYPWDRQTLTIRIQNLTADQTDLMYVADPDIVTASQDARQGSGFDLSRPFAQLPNWGVSNVDFGSISASATSDDYDAPDLVHYSEFQVLIDIDRDVRGFLITNLLPLILLTIVTYISLWFPPEDARTRITFSITAILTSVVMLNTIASRLPAIGYTVAIEWAFYVFIGVVAILALLNLSVYHSYEAKRYARVRRLDWLIRIAYVVVVGVTVAAYYWRYG